jgi:lactate dehydrogenase-like 2-hydroxyacid dehydrogenase
VAGAVDDATATAALYLLIGACRRFGPGEIDARRGVFDSKLDWDGHDPEGKTLGLVGMGGIGRALARRCLAFDMTILYHNRSEWVGSKTWSRHADARCRVNDKTLAAAGLQGKVKASGIATEACS